MKTVKNNKSTKTKYYALISNSPEYLEFYKLINDGKNVGNFSGKIARAAFKGMPTKKDLKKAGATAKDECILINAKDYQIITENEKRMNALHIPYPLNRLPLEILKTEHTILFATDELLLRVPENYFVPSKNKSK